MDLEKNIINKFLSNPSFSLFFKQIKRFAGVILTGLLSGALLLWVVVKYDTWFGNPNEEPYLGLTEPGRVLLTFGDENDMSRNVSWAGNSMLQDAYLELIDQNEKDTTVISAEGEVFKSRSGEMAYYHAKLRNLKEGTSYQYRAVTAGTPSAWYNFKTPIKDRKNYSFLYIGDVQDSIGGSANRMLREVWERNADSEFLLCTGDLIERPMDSYWQEMSNTLDSIGQTLPILNAAGNHDYLKAPIYQLEKRFSLVFSYFLDSKVDDNQVYTLKYKDIQFFVLDGTREFLFLPKQRTWLQMQLMNSHAKWKIVVIHHPLYSVRGESKNIIQRWFFNDLLEEYHVDLVLQGHEHAYARTTRLDQSGKQQTPVYLISHCSNKNYLIQFDDKFQKFGSGSKYYQKITVHGDSLGISARDADTHALYDSLLLVNKNGITQVIDKGLKIKESVEFRGEAKSKKEKEFIQKIKDYKKNHPNRF